MIICNLERCLWTVITGCLFIIHVSGQRKESDTSSGSNRKRFVRMCQRGNLCRWTYSLAPLSRSSLKAASLENKSRVSYHFHLTCRSQVQVLNRVTQGKSKPGSYKLKLVKSQILTKQAQAKVLRLGLWWVWYFLLATLAKNHQLSWHLIDMSNNQLCTIRLFHWQISKVLLTFLLATVRIWEYKPFWSGLPVTDSYSIGCRIWICNLLMIGRFCQDFSDQWLWKAQDMFKTCTEV